MVNISKRQQLHRDEKWQLKATHGSSLNIKESLTPQAATLLNNLVHRYSCIFDVHWRILFMYECHLLQNVTFCPYQKKLYITPIKWPYQVHDIVSWYSKATKVIYNICSIFMKIVLIYPWKAKIIATKFWPKERGSEKVIPI